METLLEKILGKIRFLNIGSPQLLAEFASHIGWSLGFMFICYCLAGDAHLVKAGWIWIIYSVVKELGEDGHLVRLIKGQESAEEFKDFLTDLLSRVIGPFLFVLSRVLK
jgi:hypothetical protein